MGLFILLKCHDLKWGLFIIIINYFAIRLILRVRIKWCDGLRNQLQVKLPDPQELRNHQVSWGGIFLIPVLSLK